MIRNDFPVVMNQDDQGDANEEKSGAESQEGENGNGEQTGPDDGEEKPGEQEKGTEK